MSFLAKPNVCRRCIQNLRTVAQLKTFPIAFNRRRQPYSVKHAQQDGRPFRMAVIGSGPAGFYTAYKVMSQIDNTTIDMYEHLPVPFGLVRYGVAPDHPEVKNCQDKFEEVAASPNFNFVGNISIGNTPGCLPLSTLAPHYDAILFSYGASKDRTLGIKGEDTLSGIYSARSFVGWYNGLPEYANLAPDMSLGEEAVVIGQGNVALDVARILLTPIDILRKTDITETAIDALIKSRVKRVRVVGRRGPLQAAFTIKEIRELMKLPGVAFHPMDPSLMPTDMSQLSRPRSRIMKLLAGGSENKVDEVPMSWSLDYKLSPTSFNAHSSSPSRLSSMTFEANSLPPDSYDMAAKATGTGEIINLPADIAFRSIGYKSEALPGFEDLGISFDDRRGIILNDQMGRVLHSQAGLSGHVVLNHVPGMYCAGWVKRGPTGVIASTMADAFSTADVIAEDWLSHVPFIKGSSGESQKHGWEGLKEEAKKRGLRRVTWQDWKKIDQAERSKGKAIGKEREKFTGISDMLAVVD